ncbi:hypothetical protein [Lacticaseibacillus paracasei]|uniref:hypothetical protein n=1 Tax=Lacticaseibacillus paracasei TaxID=1597 RepID=UPI002477CD3E|nr:hypothetical protein [Lacticaseibacillus paracasei]MDH7443960.1 hypothetical protein [Lacticaseibacillus paracasei subsp. paracasei]
MSKAQQKALKVDQQQLQAAKKIFSVQDTFNTELGEDQVLKDEGFKIQAFNNDFTYLQAHKAKFAATIKDKATLLDREVKAVALVKRLRPAIQIRRKLIRLVMPSMLLALKHSRINTYQN